MAAVALTLYAVYVLAAFVLRGLKQYRRTGETGFRGVRGRPGSTEWWGGALFALALVLGPAGPAVQLAGVLAPLAFLDHQAVAVVGLVLAGAGILATLLAQRNMGTSWRIGVDQREVTALVTAGAFALARNPIFTAMVSAALGLLLLAPNPVAVAGLACLVAAIQIQVRVVEEPYLIAVHGDAYRAYAASTGRFLPRVGRLP
ncbi:methyltransferase family protein [Amycolatopsis cihanbeyliensis]|uniref:Protein-S-isoprenylcysteine O-methyltransferase Ste14 n=1 Tax=Amycolatopsis cihanbeyliensis TaxID=1128664 RepID=A0A542CSW0_AMYCI|nr:isoprenylcysteine carboxylmethyltransferase family protein [Amycolatopsis cihanbeyliensis]TQI93916.1 protein-S-isoprenylcysteine O-methyltransferase Ste14 [Amycolatopsis cihanbeyliensis]